MRVAGRLFLLLPFFPLLAQPPTEVFEGLSHPQMALNTILSGHAGIRLPRLTDSPKEKLCQLVLRCLYVYPACLSSMEEVQLEL